MFVEQKRCKVCDRVTPHVYTTCQRCAAMKDTRDARNRFNAMSVIQRDTYLMGRLVELEKVVEDLKLDVEKLRRKKNKYDI